MHSMENFEIADWKKHFSKKYTNEADVDRLTDHALENPDFSGRVIKFGLNNPWVEWEMNRLKEMFVPWMQNEKTSKT